MKTKDIKETTNALGYHDRFGFPYRTTLSFQLLIKSLEQKAAMSNEPTAPMVQQIVNTIKAIPELNLSIDDLSTLIKYRKEIDLMMMTVVSLSLADEVLTGVVIPFQPVTVYGTKKFNELLKADESGVWDLSNVKGKPLHRELIALAGMLILEKHYGVAIERTNIFNSKILDRITSSASFYKPEVSTEYIEVNVLKEPKPLAEIDLSPLNLNFFDEEFWLTNFPPDTFEFTGLAIYRMIDVTDQEMISGLEYALLEPGSIISRENFPEVQNKLRIYFNVPDLRLGLTPIESYHGKMAESSIDKWYSFIPVEQMQTLFKNFEQSIYTKAIQQRTPLLIDDLEQMSPRSPIEEEILKQGIRSIIVIPFFHAGELTGVIEIGSNGPQAFNFVTLLKLKEMLPLFRMAFHRESKEFDSRVQAAIKEHFTSIHPAVEWKFVDAVLKLVGKGEVEEVDLPVIELSDVTPIYGQIDIRGSSEKRNEAIHSDMIDYITGARAIMNQAYKEYPLPIFEELNFKMEQYIAKIKQETDSGDEMGMLDFIRQEVEPLFRMLFEKDLPMKEQIRLFIEEMDPDHEQHHMRRKDFDCSLDMINDLITKILDEEEERTQKLIPHFFEKYKTDGVEYNIYIGKSILEKGAFDPVFIRNFRLWQLLTTVNIARETHRLIPQMKMPLETTQLILCYNNPLSIIFRMDEKRFDVTGAYNIGYEIAKKRIDKATINGTEERITQPNTIAIIYTQDKEAREYGRYFEFLRAKNLITSETEYLEVEPLQGLQGLKVMRITINYNEDESKLSWDEEEILRHVTEEVA